MSYHPACSVHEWLEFDADCSAEVVSLVASILPLVALFQVFDGAASITGGIFRARGKQVSGCVHRRIPTFTTRSFLGCRRHSEPLRLLRPWYPTWIIPLVRAWTWACRPLGGIDCRAGVRFRSRDLDWCPWCRLESRGRDRTRKS